MNLFGESSSELEEGTDTEWSKLCRTLFRSSIQIVRLWSGYTDAF